MQEWKWWEDWNKPVIFFGLYHFLDYLKFIFARGPKIAWWCGGDIINLAKSNIPWNRILRFFKARHFCESIVEVPILERLLKTKVGLKPIFLSDPKSFQISFYSSRKPHVFMNAHPGREKEYGVHIVEEISLQVPEVTFHIYGISSKSHDNVMYHGKVSEAQFNEEIKNYQASIRLNLIDGFSEVIAKSVLMGQYPISRIKYPYIDYAEDAQDLIDLLKKLKYKKEPNYIAQHYWYNELCKPLLQ